MAVTRPALPHDLDSAHFCRDRVLFGGATAAADAAYGWRGALENLNHFVCFRGLNRASVGTANAAIWSSAGVGFVSVSPVIYVRAASHTKRIAAYIEAERVDVRLLLSGAAGSIFSAAGRSMIYVPHATAVAAGLIRVEIQARAAAGYTGEIWNYQIVEDALLVGDI